MTDASGKVLGTANIKKDGRYEIVLEQPCHGCSLKVERMGFVTQSQAWHRIQRIEFAVVRVCAEKEQLAISCQLSAVSHQFVALSDRPLFLHTLRVLGGEDTTTEARRAKGEKRKALLFARNNSRNLASNRTIPTWFAGRHLR